MQNRQLLCFGKNLRVPPNLKLYRADLDRVFVDHVPVRFGITRFVGHVPTKNTKERVEEILAKLCFVVLSALVIIKVPVKAFDQLGDFIWQPHQHPTVIGLNLFSKTVLQVVGIVQKRDGCCLAAAQNDMIPRLVYARLKGQSPHSLQAMKSISTETSFGRRETSTVARAGGSTGK